jgi:hypothetical protein
MQSFAHRGLRQLCDDPYAKDCCLFEVPKLVRRSAALHAAGHGAAACVQLDFLFTPAAAPCPAGVPHGVAPHALRLAFDQRRPSRQSWQWKDGGANKNFAPSDWGDERAARVCTPKLR